MTFVSICVRPNRLAPSVGLRFSMSGAAQLEPVALVDKADGEQQRAQAEKAEDPVALAEGAHVDEEDLADRDGEDDKALPAQERRAAGATGGQPGGVRRREPRGGREPI